MFLLNDFSHSKKCADKRRETLERSNINTVTDAVTETPVSNPTKVEIKKSFTNWIFENINQNFSDKIISTNKLSTKQNGAENSEINVMLESKGNFYKFNHLNFMNFHSPLWKEMKIFDYFNITLGENLSIPMQQRICVRKIIEDLIASMLGGSLDDVFVGQLFNNLECKSLIYSSYF